MNEPLLPAPGLDEQGDLYAVVDFELVEEAGDVALDGRDREVQRGGDLGSAGATASCPTPAGADRMMIIGGGRIRAQGTRTELLTTAGTVVEAADLAGLDAALERAGLIVHPADGDRRLVEAEPEVVARAAMADDIVLRRLAPAEGAGL